jgi:hypothetical protein
MFGIRSPIVLWIATFSSMFICQIDVAQQSLPVLHGRPPMGEVMGEGAKKGFDASMEEQRERRRFQEALDADLIAQAFKENAEKRQAAARACEQEQNNKILQSLLQGYTPEKNSEYVLRILKSQLPMQMKKDTIAILNEQAELYSEKPME